MVRSVNWGVKGLVIDVVEYTHPTTYLGVVLRPSNFNSFSLPDRIHIAEKVNDLVRDINDKGCPAYAEFYE